MVSFRKNLVLILAGVVCLNFFLVFVSFNYLMEQYIQKEAENSVNLSVQSLASTVEISRQENVTADLHESVILDKATITDQDVAQEALESYHIRFEENPLAAEDFGSVISISMRPATLAKTIFTTDYVVLDRENDVVFPSPLPDVQDGEELAEDTYFVVSYFTANETKFEDYQFVRADRGEGSVYMSAVPLEEGYRALAFMDTTQIQSFTERVNWTLCGLMVLSGFVAVLAGTRMSGGMNKTLKGLSGYAEKIGTGDFSVEEHGSKYKELNQLGKSMAEMTHKLKLYDEQQKEFFQNASHELRTPLMSIQGYAEGIAQDVFEDTKEAAAVIVEESREMAELVRQLLYISRLDSQSPEPEREELDLREVVSAACERMTVAAGIKGVVTECALPEAPVLLKGNAEQLLNAFVNLLDNSIRYAKRQVKITLTEEPGQDCKPRISLQIADDGCGLAPEDLPRIFERLYKGHGGNAGLGLAIVEKVVKGHGGVILADNQQDGGAVFTITFD